MSSKLEFTSLIHNDAKMRIRNYLRNNHFSFESFFFKIDVILFLDLGKQATLLLKPYLKLKLSCFQLV